MASFIKVAKINSMLKKQLQCNVFFTKSSKTFQRPKIDQKKTMANNDHKFQIVLRHFIFFLPFTFYWEQTGSNIEPSFMLVSVF